MAVDTVDSDPLRHAHFVVIPMSSLYIAYGVHGHRFPKNKTITKNENNSETCPFKHAFKAIKHKTYPYWGTIITRIFYSRYTMFVRFMTNCTHFFVGYFPLPYSYPMPSLQSNLHVVESLNKFFREELVVSLFKG